MWKVNDLTDGGYKIDPIHLPDLAGRHRFLLQAGAMGTDSYPLFSGCSNLEMERLEQLEHQLIIDYQPFIKSKSS